MMGIPIDGATHIYEDDMSVINNASKPESILQKKNNFVHYHTVYKSADMGKSLIAHTDSNETPVDGHFGCYLFCSNLHEKGK